MIMHALTKHQYALYNLENFLKFIWKHKQLRILEEKEPSQQHHTIRFQEIT